MNHSLRGKAVAANDQAKPLHLPSPLSVCLDACPPIIHPTHPFLHLFIRSPSSLHQELNWHAAVEGSVQGADSDSSLTELGCGLHLSPSSFFSYLHFPPVCRCFVPVLQIECRPSTFLASFAPFSIIPPFFHHIRISNADY